MATTTMSTGKSYKTVKICASSNTGVFAFLAFLLLGGNLMINLMFSLMLNAMITINTTTAGGTGGSSTTVSKCTINQSCTLYVMPTLENASSLVRQLTTQAPGARFTNV
jgi:hypothetical protein